MSNEFLDGVGILNKVLFFDEKEKMKFIAYLNNDLKIKNRLLKLIISNPDKKTSRIESGKKTFKYEQQIGMLQNILSQAMNTKSRDDIQKLNTMIDGYHSLENY